MKSLIILRLTEEECEYLESSIISNLVNRIRNAVDYQAACVVLRETYRVSALYKLQRKRLKELTTK